MATGETFPFSSWMKVSDPSSIIWLFHTHFAEEELDANDDIDN